MNRGTQRLIAGSAHSLALRDQTVHCCVTSPPYYSLRKYAGEQEIDWPEVVYHPMPGLPELTIPAMTAALGLEPTPEAFIGHLVLCFREVWRVLRDDGVAWLNLGDSFASGGRQGHGTRVGYKQQTNRGMDGVHDPPRQDAGIGDGQLLMIPHRTALALQGDGWTVRNDVVWAKTSPMPESVAGWRWERCRVKVKPGRPPADQDHLPDNGQRPGGNRGNQWGDVQNQPNATWHPCPGCAKCEATGGYVLRRGSWRHTRAHEFVFMLTKKLGYFANQEAVREEIAKDRIDTHYKYMRGEIEDYSLESGKRPKTGKIQGAINPAGRNPRSVVSPSPRPFPGSHYAVFPPDLIAPLIRATCPTRCCPVCGAGWAAVVEKADPVDRPDNPNPATPYTADSGHTNATGATTLHKIVTTTSVGHRPTCECGHVHVDEYGPGWYQYDPIPGTVLDPFAGSGTTLEVARELGVNGIGVDLSPAYLDEHAKVRIGRTPSTALDELPLFAGVT